MEPTLDLLALTEQDLKRSEEQARSGGDAQ